MGGGAVRAQDEIAVRLGLKRFVCRLCEVEHWLDGMGYDELLGVCSMCAGRIHNLYERKHGGRWFSRERAMEEDLAWFGDSRDAPPPEPSKSKAKIKNALRMKVYERDGFKCVYCGSRKQLSLDHVTPESKGGATSEGNLVTACRPCNTKKKTKSLADFWGARQ